MTTTQTTMTEETMTNEMKPHPPSLENSYDGAGRATTGTGRHGDTIQCDKRALLLWAAVPVVRVRVHVLRARVHVSCMEWRRVRPQPDAESS